MSEATTTDDIGYHHGKGLNLAWSNGANDGVARLVELRKRPNYTKVPPANMVENYLSLIRHIWAEANERKWSGFLWIAPGAQLLLCSFIKGDVKRVGYPGIKDWIGGGYVERAPIMMPGRRVPLIVDEEGLLKAKAQNVIGSRLYDGMIVGEAVMPIGKTSWGY